MEAHFRDHHLNDAVEEVEVCEVSGENAKTMVNPRTLAEFLKDQWHKQKHFPMQLSTHLSKQFSRMGLQFFKKDKKVTHVSVARPNFLDVESEPVSGGVKKIMQFIDGTEECTRRQILEHLGGMEHLEPQEGVEPAAAPEQTEEQKQLTSDLHWLIHQGHVLEFSNGIIETAKKPKKKPGPLTESKTPDASSDETVSEPRSAKTEATASVDKETSESDLETSSESDPAG